MNTATSPHTLERMCCLIPEEDGRALRILRPSEGRMGPRVARGGPLRIDEAPLTFLALAWLKPALEQLAGISGRGERFTALAIGKLGDCCGQAKPA